MWRRLVDVARKRRSFWASVPPRGHALILAAAFAVFAGIGFITDILSLGRYPLPIVFAIAGLTGAVAVFWALTIIRSAVFLPLVVALYLFAFWLSAHYDTPGGLRLDPAGGAALVSRVKIDSAAVITAVATGYGLFIVFIAVEGRRYMRAHTEVALAQDIHRHLVPSIDRTVGRFEFFGKSLPSSEVGGDLVDVVEKGERWVAYVADVSGHGVASGTLMGMFKSAVRARLASDVPIDVLLTEVNGVITGLRNPGMFVTCAFVSIESVPSGDIRFVTAGHPPILLWRSASGAVEELSQPQVPIAMIDNAPPFQATGVRLERGDVMALVSDGLMEVFDRRDHEYGIEALKRALAAGATRPLPELFDAMVADVRRYGPQLDDQSLLLVRVLR
jgi:serine phosphatase RsbU (regulator of sigma subunit)